MMNIISVVYIVISNVTNKSFSWKCKSIYTQLKGDIFVLFKIFPNLIIVFPFYTLFLLFFTWKRHVLNNSILHSLASWILFRFTDNYRTFLDSLNNFTNTKLDLSHGKKPELAEGQPFTLRVSPISAYGLTIRPTTSLINLRPQTIVGIFSIA